jgi:hypothetical protein
LQVDQVLIDSPGAAAGVKKDDVVFSIAGVLLFGLPQAEADELLEGPHLSTVTLALKVFLPLKKKNTKICA